tara:strand:+ start:394 stop:1293 length:900 start_codon:yes stop_codon:yes gene_type:complete
MTANIVHLFLNPTANRGRANQCKNRIIRILEESGISVITYVSQSKKDLETNIFNRVEKGATRIIVAGGDGSIHEAVNGILKSNNKVMLGIVPIGTGNDFAKSNNISLDWEHTTKSLSQRIVEKKMLRVIDIGKCNDRFFINSFGCGFDVKVALAANSIKLPIGKFIYLLAFIKALFKGTKGPDLEIQSNEFSWKGPVTFASINNSSWVGGMFNIAPMADNTDGMLDVLIAKPMTRLEVVLMVPKFLNKTHDGSKQIIHKSITYLSLNSKKNIYCQLDGEIQALQKRFEIQTVKKILTLL